MIAVPIFASSLPGTVSVSLADPLSASPLLDAVGWIEDALLGTVATAVAVIAVGTIGATTLTGRIRLRDAATVILGCFILFGAPAIAAGIRSALFIGNDATLASSSSSAVPLPAISPLPPAASYDPYAGASVPMPH